MKRLMLHSMFAAAAVVAVAGSASAQNVKADIPFAFRVGNVVLQPGTYEVQTEPGLAPMFRLYNRETKQGAILVGYATHDVSKSWAGAGVPRLGFRCAGSTCAVAELWMGGAYSSVFHMPKTQSGDPVRIAEVRLTKAE